MAAPHRYTAKVHSPHDDPVTPTHRLVWDRTTGTHRKWTKTAPFIMGPIPLDWVTRANGLPGKAGAVGIALWFLKGVKGGTTFNVTAEARRVAACSRQAFGRGLDALEDAGLIALMRRVGRNPEVTILSARKSPA